MPAQTIDSLPDDEREAFDLVRIQGLTYGEASELLGVAPRTVQRRLDRGLQLLTERLGDLKSKCQCHWPPQTSVQSSFNPLDS